MKLIPRSITKHAFLFSIIEGKLTKMVSKEQLASMLDKRNIYDALLTITNTDIGEFLRSKVGPESALDEVEQALHQYLWNEMLFLRDSGLREVGEFVNAYIVKYDLLNTIFTIRALFYNRETSKLLSLGLLYENNLLEELFGAKNFKDVIFILGKASLHDFARIVNDYSERLRGKDLSALRIVESELYESYFNNLLRIASIIGGGLELKRAIQKLIDSYNISIVLRGIVSKTPKALIESSIIEPTIYISRELLLEAAEQNNITQALQILSHSPYERMITRISSMLSASANESLIEVVLLQEFSREIEGDKLSDYYSPLPVLSYIIYKELEVSMLRVILWSIWNNMPRKLVEPVVRGVSGEG